jgi:osmotically-inducible protein OsmY
MADYNRDYESERYGRRYEDEGRYGRSRRGREDRGTWERAGDEVRSWFGDEEAERRRRMDELEEERRYGRQGWRGSRYNREDYRGEYGRGYGRENYRGEYERGFGSAEDQYRRSSQGYTGGGREYGRSSYESRPESGYGSYGQRGYMGNRDYDRYSGYDPEYRRGDEYSEYGTESSYTMPYWSYSEVWMVPGPHTGRGPSGWRRSDDRISEDVNERLQRHGQIDASSIIVGVKEGEVTLSGSVNSRLEKRMAEDVAESCSGVREVHNNLRVIPQNQIQSGFQSSQQPQQTQTEPQATSRSRTTSS